MFRKKQWSDAVYIFFVIGKDSLFEADVDVESTVYDDIIQGSFEDTYRNNTYKTVMTYRWSHLFCSHIPYVLLIDDDYIMNFDNILQFINTNMNTFNERQMFGTVIRNWRPVRNLDNLKSYVSEKEYSYHCYPDYLAGGATLTSSRVAKEISMSIPFFKLFPVDDAYIGVVTEQLRIAKIDENRMPYKNIPLNRLNESLCFHALDDANFYMTLRNFINLL